MNWFTRLRTYINNVFNKDQTDSGLPQQGLAQRLSFSKHHLLYFSLIFAVLGGILLYQSFGAQAPVVASVEAENMLLPSGASLISSKKASAGRAVKMTKNGTLTFTTALNSDTSTIGIRAYGSRCHNIWPKITVSLDDRAAFNLDVSASTWHHFKKALKLTKGTHKLSITYTNASGSVTKTSVGNSGGCLRSLFLDKITFFGQPGNEPPPPPAPPSPLTPALNFTANSMSVARGGSSTLSWSTTNADACIASGAWSGTKAVSGSESTGALTSTQTYTLTCSGTGGSVAKSVTVTVASLTPPPPPPPLPPPPPSGSTTCRTDNYQSWNWTQCRVGTTITLTNQSWHCRQALSSYGALPIKVVILATAPWSDAGAVTINSGCTGSAGTDINLIVDIRGSGPNSPGGPGHDSFKTRQNPQNIRVTGSFQCGQRASGAHQDALQIQGGTNIAFVNVTGGGDYDAGTSTCQGAGGGPFYSTNTITNVDIIGGKWIACNHALNGGQPGTNNDVIGAKFRTGRTSDPNCQGFAASPPCINTSPLRLSDITCEQWLNNRWTASAPR